MGKKRKRGTSSQPAKRVRREEGAPRIDEGGGGDDAHPVLSAHYSRVVPLRTYLLELLPASSRARRRRIASEGVKVKNETENINENTTKPEGALARVLDSTLVGVRSPPDPKLNSARQRDFAAFSQSQARSSDGSAGTGTATRHTSELSEIVDFAILSLFNRHRGTFQRPCHVLCNGFQRASERGPHKRGHVSKLDAVGPGAPAASGVLRGIGIVPTYPNKNVSLLKSPPWTELPGLLGRSAEEIVLHLLLDCGVFVRLDSVAGELYQLSGVPLVDVPLLNQPSLPQKSKENKSPIINSPTDIVFVRQRMFYARPALNAKGRVKFGLRHIHVLNRYPASDNLDHTVQVMKYIFPRQFGLHNVFTSTVDRGRETVQPFKDYTLREYEISRSNSMRRLRAPNHNPNQKIPKRLRGHLVSLIQKLQKRQRNCAYVEMLKHYCPSSDQEIPSTTTCAMVDFATPTAAVSAFCRAVLKKLLPGELCGSGADGVANRDRILRYVDIFVGLGRFENLSLHEVSQGLKISCIKWLDLPNDREETCSSKLALSDLRKRTEIFLEFVYYVFDSLLIPLIRSNFYVTESSVHRNRVFYFRHDVWRRLAEPATASLKAEIFEEVKRDRAERILARRPLGFSHLRLLPKSSGARPIVNLRRRPMKRTAPGGRTELGPSINSLMAPMHSVLNYKRGLRPEALGSAVMSVPEVYDRLKRFKGELVQQGLLGGDDGGGARLYFVKLDVQSCFDAIPQKRLVQLVERLVGDEDEYRIARHAEVKPPLNQSSASLRSNYLSKSRSGTTRSSRWDKPRRRFVARAAASADPTSPLDGIARDGATRPAGPDGNNKQYQNNNKRKNNTVFVDIGANKTHDTHDLLNLLEQHVRNNLVRIGKKYFRQKNGIPQGSVVSAILCNLFYGEHERDQLGFLRGEEDNDGTTAHQTLLLRFVDDYLLITAHRDTAERFLRVMLDGSPEYGISVRSEKTLVNFDISIKEAPIPRLHPSAKFQFPYCGNLIDTRTLAISKDRPFQGQQPKKAVTVNNSAGAVDGLRVSDTLTVETSRAPGQTFHRKTLDGLRLHLHGMFLDTAHNGPRVALRNIYSAFVDAAVKMVAYQVRLHKRGQSRPKKDSNPSSEQLLMRIVSDLIKLAVAIVRARQQSSLPAPAPPTSPTTTTSSSLPFKITPAQVTWLAVMAFRMVLGRRQTRFVETLGWLARLGTKVAPRTDGEAKRLWGVVREVASIRV